MADAALPGFPCGSRRIAHKRLDLDLVLAVHSAWRGFAFRPAALEFFSIWRWLNHMGNWITLSEQKIRPSREEEYEANSQAVLVHRCCLHGVAACATGLGSNRGAGRQAAAEARPVHGRRRFPAGAIGQVLRPVRATRLQAVARQGRLVRQQPLQPCDDLYRRRSCHAFVVRSSLQAWRGRQRLDRQGDRQAALFDRGREIQVSRRAHRAARRDLAFQHEGHDRRRRIALRHRQIEGHRHSRQGPVFNRIGGTVRHRLHAQHGDRPVHHVRVLHERLPGVVEVVLRQQAAEQVFRPDLDAAAAGGGLRALGAGQSTLVHQLQRTGHAGSRMRAPAIRRSRTRRITIR